MAGVRGAWNNYRDLLNLYAQQALPIERKNYMP